jgi:hypothetical protein
MYSDFRERTRSVPYTGLWAYTLRYFFGVS